MTSCQRLCLVLACGIALAAFAPGAQAQCISGAISAELQMTGPFTGLYKYTVEVEWSTDRGASNFTLDCGLGFCPDEACTQEWFFDSPAGSGTGGEPDYCDFIAEGEFNCEGNPSIGFTDPALKWDIVGDCDGGKTGTATLCFYTAAPPFSGQAPIVLLKNSGDVCSGMIIGDCPLICPVPTEPATWGSLKNQY